jgi:PAS domain S-box-containing protein
MSEPLRVLQVEDSESDAALILRELKKEGYEVQAKRVEDPGALREALENQEWDVIIADYNLPGFNAPAALKILQEVGCDIPFLVVSGAIGEDVAVEMMKAGAHDYLMKNNLARLAPAVKRELREASHRCQLAQQRRALVASEERLRMAMEAAKIGTFEWNVTSGEVYWSPNLESSVGLPAGGFEGTFEAFGRFVHPEDRDRIHRAIRQSMESGSDYEVELRMIRPDGSMRWALARGRVLFGEAGKPDRMIGIDIDITARKKGEEDLLRSQAQARAQAENLAAILDAVPAMTFIAHDPACKTMTSSRAGLELLRLPPGANTSMSAPPNERPNNFRMMKGGKEVAAKDLPVQRAAATGRDVRASELRISFNDGSYCDIFGHAVPLWDEQGRVRGAVGAFVDVTEQKRLEELKYQGIIRRQLLEREILAREEERRRIARELHDETGQVLASLLAGLRLIEFAENTRQAKRRAKAVSKTVAHTMDIVGRVARGLHPLALEDFGLPPALNNYVAEYSRLHGIELELTMKGLSAERLPQAFERGLYRITQEALTNIAKHARAHSAKISVRLDKKALTLTIADDGCGFDVRRFYRESSAQSLGLQTMKERASMLGGELTVGSRPGKGTRIRFRVSADKVVGPGNRS